MNRPTAFKVVELFRNETSSIFTECPMPAANRNENMTRKEIDKMIRTSEGQVQYALHHLRQILEHGEAKGQEVRWTKLLIGHKDLIEVLRKLKADDE